MHARYRPTALRLATAWLAAACCCGAAAAGAEVSASISSEEVFVGIPFTLTVTIRNSTTHEIPVITPVPGLVIGSPRQTSNQGITVVINGREVRNNQDVGMAVAITATEAGEYTIPPITVVADGETISTQPVQFTARRAEANGLIDVEIIAERQTVYLGEAADLTMRVWILPYENEQFEVRLSDTDMWSLLDVNRSEWGDFTDALRSLIADRFGRARPLSGREVERTDSRGKVQAYYLYEVAVSLWPQQAGELEIRPVALLMQYPLRLERTRGLLSRGQLRVVNARVVAASASVSTVTVRPPPMAGRPPYFTGAVGRFDIQASATPTDVAVGDPITLTLTITDRTPGGSRLETLQPPDLSQSAELVERFRMPTDPLAGVVQGLAKTFTQTLRARHDGVDRIPPIEFAWFDPDEERYVTQATNAIPIHVAAAATVTTGDVIGSNGVAPVAPTELTELAGGLVANRTGSDDLLASRQFTFSLAHASLVLGFPLAFGFLALVQGRVRRQRDDRAWARRRSAKRRAMKRLATAGGADAPQRAEIVANAVSGYVADRFDLPPGNVTRAEVVSHLEHRRVGRELVQEIESLLAECEHLCYAGNAGADTDSIAQRASRCIQMLEWERRA